MRITLLAGMMVFAAVSGAAFAAEPEALPDWFKERRAEALKDGPGGLVDLGCTLFGQYRYDYAFRLMQEAADAGDDAAALYASSYLRAGVGVKGDDNAADRIVMALVLKIREGKSKRFPTVADAASAIYAEKCSPTDLGTWASLLQFEKNCASAENPKPKWCS